MLYQRVSTKPPKNTDKNRIKMEEHKKRIQEVENQELQLRQFVEKQEGWVIVGIYTDRMSGKQSDRPELDRLMLDATTGKKCDIVLAWALDRFTREGVAETFNYIRLLKDSKVDFWSLTEPHFRTTGPTGELMISIAAWIAKQERTRISERTKAGLERAVKNGSILGRPQVIIDKVKIEQLHNQGVSIRNIAKMLQVSPTTIFNLMKSLSIRKEPKLLTFELE
jgi:DNA invertase Pin-like site-specific DNA recombinase